MKKQGITFKGWLCQFAALFIAWAILSAVTGLFDALCDTPARLVLTCWLVIGIGMMLSKNVVFAMPSTQRVDVPGAFKVLWMAALWPLVLIKK